MLPSALSTASASAMGNFRGSIAHPTRSLCTLRNRRHRRSRNTRYQAGATPYLGRTSTGWITSASPDALTVYKIGRPAREIGQLAQSRLNEDGSWRQGQWPGLRAWLCRACHISHAARQSSRAGVVRGRGLSAVSSVDRGGGAACRRGDLGLLPDAQSCPPDRDPDQPGWAAGDLRRSAPPLHRCHQRSVPMDGPSIPGPLRRGGDGRAATCWRQRVTSRSIRWPRGS